MVQHLLTALPEGFHHYLLSCYHNLPKVMINTGFNVLKSLNENDNDAQSSSAFFLSNSEIFRGIMTKQPYPVIFDVGANIGQTSACYATIFPNCRIHSFEPFAENYEHLLRNSGSHPNVTAHRLALSDTDGHLDVRRDNHPLSQWNSLNPEYQVILEQRGQFSTETVSLTKGDTFCELVGVSNLALLKIDTEGHEFEVLKGFERAFSRSAIQSVLLEVGFGGDSSHGKFQEVNSFLVRQGMSLCGFYDTEYTGEGNTNYTNAIYCLTIYLANS